MLFCQEKKEEVEGVDGGLVKELAERAAKWDEVAAGLPDLVARLHALQDLHQQGSPTSQAAPIQRNAPPSSPPIRAEPGDAGRDADAAGEDPRFGSQPPSRGSNR